MQTTFGEGALVLLLAAALVALAARRLRLPYSVALVLAGIGLGLSPVGLNITLTKDLIFDALLPPLIFEAAFHLRWHLLRRELPVVLTLATAGVAISLAVTAAGMHYLARWPWATSVVFGALISATDPVAVIDVFRDLGVHGRLRLLVESESLLNDGAAMVAFAAALAWASGQHPTGLSIAEGLAISIAGSLVCGAAVALATLFLVGRTQDHLVELALTTVAAYGSFLLAEQLQFSGVLATIVSGLIIGNRGPLGAISARGREAVDAFWEYAAFVANAFIFLLIGMHESTQHFDAVWLPVAIAVGVTLLARAAAVYPLCALFIRTKLRVRMWRQTALFWCGLRGALALALALDLPQELPRREEAIVVTFGVVAFSIFVQGWTVPPMLRKIGETSPDPG